MTKPSHSRRSAPEDRQRRVLARWLREWNLDRILRSVAVDSAAAGAPASGTGRSPAPCPVQAAVPLAPPRVGEIRLLHPVRTDDPSGRPVYVLVLEKRSAGSFLAAPFGRFSEPAVPGEWRTGLRAIPLRVLCLWNSRLVSAEILRSSWPAGRMPPNILGQAQEAHGHVHGAAPLVSVRPERLGPPLRHPLDPRHAYLSEEAALMDEHLIALAGESGESSGTISYEQPRSALRLAAESRPRYGRRKRPGKEKGSES